LPTQAHTYTIEFIPIKLQMYTGVIRKNSGNDVLPEANYAVLGRRYSVRKYLRVDKL